MTEYIEREAAIQAISRIGKREYDLGNTSKAAMIMIAEDALRAMPAVDIALVRHDVVDKDKCPLIAIPKYEFNSDEDWKGLFCLIALLLSDKKRFNQLIEEITHELEKE